MESMEDAFRDGLRDAVSKQPAMAPIELDEVLARAARPAARRPVGRWIGLAAAVTMAAGLGLWALQSSSRVPAEPVGTPTFGGQLRTLRVRNDTGDAYRQAALQLSDGRSLPLGDLPAGGTVLVPLGGASTPALPIQVDTSRVSPSLRVLYTGDCSTSAGEMVAIVSGSDGTSIQIVSPSAQSTGLGESAGVSATVVATPRPSAQDSAAAAPSTGPASAAPAASPPVCTITISEGRPTPGVKHS